MRDFIVDGDLSDNIFSFILSHIKPFRNAYLYRNEEGEWSKSTRYLSDRMMLSAIWGPDLYAFFQNLNRIKVVGVDIDYHEGKGWKDPNSATYLWYKYHQLLEHMPVPSLLFHSPRGLHGYWLLESELPAKMIFPALKEQLHLWGKETDLGGIEVKPTENEALRIPDVRSIIDPINGDFLDRFPEIVSYSMEDILGVAATPASVRKSLSDRKGSLNAFSSAIKIGNIEEQWTPIIDGMSNEALVHLVPAYRQAGWTVEQVECRLQRILDASPGYSDTGELRRTSRLRTRIVSFYRNTRELLYRRRELAPKERKWIEDIVAIHPWAKQRTKPLSDFLEKLISWRSFHDSVIESNSQLALFNYLYPYYGKNRKEGYYPLPKTTLRKWNFRYRQIMKWLQELNVLIPAPYKYAPNQGICKYYSIREVHPHIRTLDTSLGV